MTTNTKPVALITGASSGIGNACAHGFEAAGWTVLTAQRRPAEGFETVTCDLSDPSVPEEVIAQVIKRAGRLDALVNNAGVMIEATIDEMSLDAWEMTQAVNLRAPFLLIKHALKHLREAQGSIVNIGSVEGLGSNPQHGAYCASKAGLHGLTRAVAVDEGPNNVRCNAIAPGWIDTPLNNDFVDAMPDPDSFREQIGSIHPLGRTGKPEEVAALVVWLASESSAFMTGQVLTLDGGRMAKLSLP